MRDTRTPGPFSWVERAKLSRPKLIGNLIMEIFHRNNVSVDEALDVLDKLFQFISQGKEKRG